MFNSHLDWSDCNHGLFKVTPNLSWGGVAGSAWSSEGRDPNHSYVDVFAWSLKARLVSASQKPIVGESWSRQTISFGKENHLVCITLHRGDQIQIGGYRASIWNRSFYCNRTPAGQWESQHLTFLAPEQMLSHWYWSATSNEKKEKKKLSADAGLLNTQVPGAIALRVVHFVLLTRVEQSLLIFTYFILQKNRLTVWPAECLLQLKTWNSASLRRYRFTFRCVPACLLL